MALSAKWPHEKQHRAHFIGKRTISCRMAQRISMFRGVRRNGYVDLKKRAEKLSPGGKCFLSSILPIRSAMPGIPFRGPTRLRRPRSVGRPLISGARIVNKNTVLDFSRAFPPRRARRVNAAGGFCTQYAPRFDNADTPVRQDAALPPGSVRLKETCIGGGAKIDAAPLSRSAESLQKNFFTCKNSQVFHKRALTNSRKRITIEYGKKYR